MGYNRKTTTKKISVNESQAEARYLEKIRQYPKQVIFAAPDSVQEGFEYFSEASIEGTCVSDKFRAMGLRDGIRLGKIMFKNGRVIFKGRSKCFEDLEPYFQNMEECGAVKGSSIHRLLNSYPNKALWAELQAYAWNTWKVKMGFTQLPNQLIFRGKGVLFPYALVCIQEMEKEKIDTAPDLVAGEEVLRVYGSLGVAVNDIARWLRTNHDIGCQSNHPLGGLVNTSPLAVKAGMGWRGRNGLLVTPEFGQRQRIAPIFIEEKVFEFTDNADHSWIETFCEQCGKCRKACPAQAIYDEPVISMKDIPGVGDMKTCIDRLKCFPYFNKTLGCSVCIKVCPFSQVPTPYERLKAFTERMEKHQ